MDLLHQLLDLVTRLPEHLKAFTAEHGAWTYGLLFLIVFAETGLVFAPFVAGIGRMTYWRFIAYNVIGGVAWVAIFLFGGYFFGNLPLVRKNFTFVIFAIIVISVLPAVVEYLRHRNKKM